MANDGYLPPDIQRAMDQHMQNMPGNLQKYQSGNTYIPSNDAKSMASYMEKTMPAHMKQYIGAYMEQKVTSGLNSLDPGIARTTQPRAPTPNLMRRDHSAFGEQHSITVGDPGAAAGGSFSHMPQYSPTHKDAATPTPPPSPPPAPVPNGNQNPYDFILSSGGKPKPSLGGGSFKQRLVLALTGLAVLLILVFVFIGVLAGRGSSNADALVKVAQEQAEIIRIASIGQSKATDSTVKNLATTTQLSTQSAQVTTLSYLSKNGHKVKTSQLTLLKDSRTDQQLNDASTAGTFNDTFNQILQKQLTTYRSDLQTAYQGATGVNERKLLQDSFNSVSYLISTKS